MLDSILRSLKYPVDTIRKVQFLALHHMDTKEWKDDLSRMKPKHLRKLQYVCQSEERFRDLMLLIDADNKAHSDGFCMMHQVYLILEQTEAMKLEGSTLFDYQLPFSGDEVMQLKSLGPGPAVRECLDYLLKLAYVTPLRTREEWEKHLIGYKVKQ